MAEPEPPQSADIPEPEAGPEQHRHQNQGLQGDTQSGHHTQPGHLPVGDGRDVDLIARHPDEGDGCADHHHVVDDGREHRGTEVPACVEHLAEHRVQAVEHDLRKAEPGEGDGEVELLGGVLAGGVQMHDPGGGQHGDHREHEGDQSDDPQQAVGETVAAVLVVLHVPDQLRDEHCVQGTPGHQDVDDVGQGVAEAVGVGQSAESDGRDQRHVADQAGGARGHGAGRHQCARAQHPGLFGTHDWCSDRALLRRTKFMPNRKARITKAPETT